MLGKALRAARRQTRLHRRAVLAASAFLFAVTAGPTRAQEPERTVVAHQNAWYNYFGNHPLSESWGLHLEGQWRREGWGDEWMQLLLRSGVNFYLSPNVTLSGGYGFIRTHPYGERPAIATFPEHRIWQQALIQHKLGGRTSLQHRYRLEQRYIGQMQVEAGQTPRRVSWRYENRFRYMVRADFPLTRRDDRPDWYIAAYDEIMVNFGRNVGANVFDQNRAYLALGKALGESARIEAGYMNQIVQQRNGQVLELNHTVMVSVFSSLPFRR